MAHQITQSVKAAHVASDRTRTFALTLLAMVAFAGNSLLCRAALKHTPIDAATFTSVRVVSGAITLWLIVRLRGRASGVAGSWPSAQIGRASLGKESRVGRER